MTRSTSYNVANSEEIQEIMDSRPKWIVRNGLYLIGLFTLILAVLSGFITYPDVVKTEVILTSTSPPVRLIARTDGKIESFFVKDGQQVEEGEIIATIGSSANIQHIIYLKKVIEKYSKVSDSILLNRPIKFDHNLQLGELQPAFTELVQTLDTYDQFKNDKGYANNILILNEKLTLARRIENELKKKTILLEQQLASETKKLHSHELLLNDKIIAPLEFEEVKMKFLDQKMLMDNNNSALLENLTLQEDLGGKIKDINNQMSTTGKSILINTRKLVKELAGELAMWDHKYVIKSPVSGKAVLFAYWTKNQYLKSGEVLAIIVSPYSEPFVKGNLSIEGSGNVAVGQKVLISLHAFPYREYGMLTGTVSNLSLSALDSVYTIHIKLTRGFATTANRMIPRQPELRGSADILTDEKTIMQRLTQSVRGSFKNVDLK